MYKKTIYLFFSASLLICLAGCTEKKIKTEEKNLSTKYYLVKDTAKGGLDIDLEIEIPVQFADTSVFNSIRSGIITNLFGESFTNLPKDSLLPAFTRELINEYRSTYVPVMQKKTKRQPLSYHNEHLLSGFSLQSDKHIYVYAIERYVFMGGAHGLETKSYFNYDLENGKRIIESDIFKDNYTFALTELIKTRILEELKDYQNEKNSEPVSTLDDTDFWTESIKPNGNFYITDEGINYVYNPYEIAPYYMGQTEVSLPYDRLKPLMKSESVISYLLKAYEKKHKKETN